jgi:hypothetical protein
MIRPTAHQVVWSAPTAFAPMCPSDELLLAGAARVGIEASRPRFLERWRAGHWVDTLDQGVTMLRERTELYESYLSDSRIVASRSNHDIEDISDVTAPTELSGGRVAALDAADNNRAARHGTKLDRFGISSGVR